MEFSTTKEIERALNNAINKHDENFYNKADSILLKPEYLNLLLNSVHYQYMCSKHTYKALDIYRTQDIDTPFEIYNLRNSE